MFSLVFQLAQRVLRKPESGIPLGIDVIQTTQNTEREVNSSDTDNECFLNGTVTTLNHIEGYGLVDKHIYFSFDVIRGNEEPKLGDSVEVQASRTDSRHGWKAISVHILRNEWSSQGTLNECTSNDDLCWTKDDSSDDQVAKIVDGQVTDCHATFCILDNKYRFEIEDCKINFRPVINDLVTASIKNNKVIAWEPKLAGEIEGVVTAFDVDSGIVNENIIFFAESCQCYVQVSDGLKVVADVVESRQNIFNLRAFKLVPVNDESTDQLIKPCLVNQSGLYITNNLDFEFAQIGIEKSIPVTLCNNNSMSINFLKCKFQKGIDNPPFFVGNIGDFTEIPPNSQRTLNITCKAQSLGYHDDLAMFEFDAFIVTRPVTVFVIDPIQAILNPSAPFSRNKFIVNTQDTTDLVIVPGVKPFIPKANFEGFKPSYNIPRNLWKIVENKEDVTKALPGLLSKVDITNYVRRFSCLLHLEEIQMFTHMRNFDMFEVVLQRRGQFLSLNVPGLAEGRPSLLIGDRAMLLPPNNKCKVMYEGHIHEVYKDEIFLKFHEHFQAAYNGETYDVTFRFSRTNIRRMHESINVIHRRHSWLLFPKHISRKSDTSNSLKRFKINDINWQNGTLNIQQKEAVCRIMEGSSGALPYIIFGPPGTGKTITVVEVVTQIYLKVKDVKILICTPSNSAADLVTQRLVESGVIGQKELVRLNSYQRNFDSIPECIKSYCMDKDGLGDTAAYSIVVSTSTTAGAYMDYELPSNHFTHLFIDEAGQLTEPECMIPVSLLCKSSNMQIILAGDPKQLGPVLMSNISKSYGLQISYLERIMDIPLYSSGGSNGFNPSYVTMLIQCYRCHPAILRYPSKKFYLSQVVSNVQNVTESLILNCKLLPKKGFPIIFDGVRGIESREENSPSWFNSSEVVKACQYLGDLYKLGLTPDEVGIITPYKKQVEKLRLLATAFSLEPCKIGSVEEFQGQERRVIIITTVRSTKEHIKSDIIHNLGFVSSPKRFNVAVTRAKELLIVVGNPYVLSQDPIWDGFIKYCMFNGCCIGCDMTDL